MGLRLCRWLGSTGTSCSWIRGKSTLQALPIGFGGYEPEVAKKILVESTEKAFKPDVVSEEFVDWLSEFPSKFGDIRVCFNILLTAGLWRSMKEKHGSTATTSSRQQKQYNTQYSYTYSTEKRRIAGDNPSNIDITSISGIHKTENEDNQNISVMDDFLDSYSKKTTRRHF